VGDLTLAPRSAVLRQSHDASREAGDFSRRGLRSSWTFYVASGAGLGAAVSLATFFATRPAEPLAVVKRVSEGTAEAPAAKAPAVQVKAPIGTLQLRIKGGSGEVSLDGVRMTTAELRGKRIPAGQHTLEIIGKGQHLTTAIDVPEGKKLLINVDLKRGRVNARVTR
jgi:hypothetical protein